MVFFTFPIIPFYLYLTHSQYFSASDVNIIYISVSFTTHKSYFYAELQPTVHSTTTRTRMKWENEDDAQTESPSLRLLFWLFIQGDRRLYFTLHYSMHAVHSEHVAVAKPKVVLFIRWLNKIESLRGALSLTFIEY